LGCGRGGKVNPADLNPVEVVANPVCEFDSEVAVLGFTLISESSDGIECRGGGGGR